MNFTYAGISAYYDLSQQFPLSIVVVVCGERNIFVQVICFVGNDVVAADTMVVVAFAIARVVGRISVVVPWPLLTTTSRNIGGSIAMRAPFADWPCLA